MSLWESLRKAVGLSTTTTIPKLKLLAENPSDSKDEFSHDAIAMELVEVASSTEMPFCVGLIGDFGVGKSFVLKAVRKRLSDNPKKIRVFEFDTWRYSDEPVPRAFLHSLLHQSNLPAEDYIPKLYWSKSLPIEPRTASKAPKSLLLWFCVCLFFLVAGLHYAQLPESWLVTMSPFFTLIGVGGIGGLGVAVLKIIFGSLSTTAWETQGIPSVISTAQFEEVYNSFLEDVLPKDGRAVILVDELDRCSVNERRTVLKALRTYLQHPRCVYVVATAESGLVDADDSAFFRKMFQVSLTLDPPHPEKLRQFTEQQLQKSGFATGNRDLVDVIYLANTKEPRRVTHFINSLVLTLRIATHRLPKDETVLKNPAMLAKILAIKRDWPSQSSLISKNPHLLNHWSQACRTHDLPRGEKNEEEGSPYEDSFVSFLRRTDNIFVSDPSSFVAVAGGLAPDSFRANLELKLDSLEFDLAKQAVQGKAYDEWAQQVFIHLRELKRQRPDDIQLIKNSILTACSLLSEVPEQKRASYSLEIIRSLSDPSVLRKLEPFSVTEVLPLAVLGKSREHCLLFHRYGLMFAGVERTPVISETLTKISTSMDTRHTEALGAGILEQVKDSDENRLSDILKEWPEDSQIESLVSKKLVQKTIDEFEPTKDIQDLDLETTIYRYMELWDEKIFELMLGNSLDRMRAGGKVTNDRLLALTRTASMNRLTWTPPVTATIEAINSLVKQFGAPNQHEDHMLIALNTILEVAARGSFEDELLVLPVSRTVEYYSRILTKLSWPDTDLGSKKVEALLRGLEIVWDKGKIGSSAVTSVLETLARVKAHKVLIEFYTRFFEADVDSRTAAFKEFRRVWSTYTPRVASSVAASYCEVTMEWSNSKLRFREVSALIASTEQEDTELSGFGSLLFEWLPTLLSSSDNHDHQLANAILESSYLKELKDTERRKFTKAFAAEAGRQLNSISLQAIKIFWSDFLDDDVLKVLEGLDMSTQFGSGRESRVYDLIESLLGKRKKVSGDAIATTLTEHVMRGPQARGALENVLKMFKVSRDTRKEANLALKNSAK